MKHKIEFSKVIFIVVSAMTLFVTISTIAIVWRTSDTGPLAYLIPAVFAELGVGTGFYYNKAKAENKLKIMQAHNMTIDKSDIE